MVRAVRSGGGVETPKRRKRREKIKSKLPWGREPKEVGPLLALIAIIAMVLILIFVVMSIFGIV